jgi:hypothetical protein
MNLARRSSMRRRLERLEQRQVNPKYVDVCSALRSGDCFQ